MKDGKLSRRERDRLRHRQDILAAALDLFSEKGYHNVSMHEIAGKAEFAIGTLYKFFQNKEDLYKALVLEQGEKFHQAFNQALEKPGDEVEKLRNFVCAKYEMLRNALPFIRLYLAESKGAGFNIRVRMDEEVRKGYDDILNRLAAVFESGMKNKRFKNIAAPYHLAVALDSTLNTFLLLWLESPERHPYPEDPDTILNIFFRGLIEP